MKPNIRTKRWSKFSNDDEEFILYSPSRVATSISQKDNGWGRSYAESSHISAFSLTGMLYQQSQGKFSEYNKNILENEDRMCQLLIDNLKRLNNNAINAVCDELERRDMVNYQTLIGLMNFLVETKAPEIAAKDQQIKQLKQKVASLERSCGRYKRKYNALKVKYNQIKERLNKAIEEKKDLVKKLNEIKTHYNQNRSSVVRDFLRQHIEVANNNKNRGINGRNYPTDLKPYYVLLSFVGEFWYNILQQILELPSFRTVQRWRKEITEEYGFTSECFNGSKESIEMLRNKLWKEGTDNRCVLAIDAASVNPQVKIDITGEVHGMTEEFECDLTPEEAMLIRVDPEEYKRFIAENIEYVSKYEFVVLLCPLDPAQMSFPVLCSVANSGAATEETRNSLDKVKRAAEECGFDVVGYAFDGDRQYLQYSNLFLDGIEDIIWEVSKLESPLSQLWDNSKFFSFFYDMLHLIKCDRYRKAKNKDTCVWPTMEEALINKERFKEFNKKYCNAHKEEKDLLRDGCIQDWLLNDKKEIKMHDDVPLRLFTPKHIHALFEMHEYDLMLSLLPSTYLVEAVMNQYITRETRLQYLTIGFCIVMLFYLVSKERMDESQSFDNIEGKNFSLFNLDYAKKYLILAWSLTQQTSDPRCVQLGALGTHFLEHFFGTNRRVNNGNDTAENFERAIQFHLLSSTIQREINLKTTQPRRTSSSGARLPEEKKEIFEMPLIHGMNFAVQLIKKAGVERIGCDIGESIINSLEIGYNDEELQSILPIITDSKVEVSSLKCCGAGHAGGRLNDARYALHSEIDNL